MSILHIIIISIFADVFGMGIGGIITGIWGKRSSNMIRVFLALAGGVMLSIVFVELIPEAIEYSSLLIGISGVIAGGLIVFVLNILLDRILKLEKEKCEKDDASCNNRNMIRSGWVMLLAIGLHNIPEGFAMGAAAAHDAHLGIAIAIIIGLHNIPEGMAVASMFVSGGFSRKKVIIITFLAGVPSVLGAYLGAIVGNISDFAVAVSLSVAGGAMLFVVFREMLPNSLAGDRKHVPIIAMLAGIALGVGITMIH
ncbi:MAG: ZIP family metal transporter [Defluviitaleaceae bacterium]|nr:ZIP family metal transporter [Defluviitaleaceae bacterium]